MPGVCSNRTAGLHWSVFKQKSQALDNLINWIIIISFLPLLFDQLLPKFYFQYLRNIKMKCTCMIRKSDKSYELGSHKKNILLICSELASKYTLSVLSLSVNHTQTIWGHQGKFIALLAHMWKYLLKNYRNDTKKNPIIS